MAKKKSSKIINQTDAKMNLQPQATTRPDNMGKPQPQRRVGQSKAPGSRPSGQGPQGLTPGTRVGQLGAPGSRPSGQGPQGLTPGIRVGQLEAPSSGPLGREPEGLAPDVRTKIIEDRASGRMRRVALALEGGGAFGAFQVGVLQNLFKRGLSPVIVTATSVGALNAAKVAEGGGIGCITELLGLWRGIKDNDSIYKKNPLVDKLFDRTLEEWKGWALFSAAWTFFGGMPWFAEAEWPGLDASLDEFKAEVDAIESFNLQDPLIELVEQNINPQKVADSGILLRLAAVARDSGDLRFFTEYGDVETVDGFMLKEGRQDGPNINLGDKLLAPNLADGVIASSAIPMIFKPWLVQGGEYYWDGAVREAVPIRKALELGATDLVAILTGSGPWADRPQFEPRDYALVIERVKQVDDPDEVDLGIVRFSGRADYYVSVKVGHGDPVRSPVRDDDRDFQPYWTFPGAVGEIRISVYDSEDNPDHCDVSPVEDQRDLHLYFDGETIDGDVAQIEEYGRDYPDNLPKVGDLIHVKGKGEADRVEIWFRFVSYDKGSSYASSLPDLIRVSPVIRLLQAMGQMQKEVDIGDYDILDMLDVIHEMAVELGEQPVVHSLNSQNIFPLPRDIRGRAYALPRYTVIEAPISLGSIVDFDENIIKANIEIGKIVGKYTRVGFLDCLDAPLQAGRYVNPTQDPDKSDVDLAQEMKSAILAYLDEVVSSLREKELARGENWLYYARLCNAIERKLNQYRDAHIVPTRRSILDTSPLP
jgi:predicted acylesterase/phospholipase RssA